MNQNEQTLFTEYNNLRMEWDKPRTLRYLWEKFGRQFKLNLQQIEEIINKYEYKL